MMGKWFYPKMATDSHPDFFMVQQQDRDKTGPLLKNTQISGSDR